MLKTLARKILRDELKLLVDKALGTAQAVKERDHHQRRAMSYWDALTEIENLETPKAAHAVKKAAQIAREAKKNG